MHLTFDNKLQEVSGDHVILKLTDPVQHMNFTAINDNLYHNTHHRIVVLAMEALFMITLLHGITIIETKHPDSVRRVDGNYKHKRNQLQQTHKRIQKPFKNELFHTVDELFHTSLAFSLQASLPGSVNYELMFSVLFILIWFVAFQILILKQKYVFLRTNTII
eukprot:210779_1